jgi:hypothetical protein
MADQGLPGAGRFVTSAHKTLFANRIRQIISDLGRTVTFVLTPLQINCPNCGWDYTQNRSNNIYTSNASGVTLNKSFTQGTRCPVCKGKGKLEFQRTVDQTSLIGFGPPPEEFDYEKYGAKPTEVVRLKNAIAIALDIDQAQYAKIDGAEYEKIAFPRQTGLGTLAFLTTYWKRRNT